MASRWEKAALPIFALIVLSSCGKNDAEKTRKSDVAEIPSNMEMSESQYPMHRDRCFNSIITLAAGRCQKSIMRSIDQFHRTDYSPAYAEYIKNMPSESKEFSSLQLICPSAYSNILSLSRAARVATDRTLGRDPEYLRGYEEDGSEGYESVGHPDTEKILSICNENSSSIIHNPKYASAIDGDNAALLRATLPDKSSPIIVIFKDGDLILYKNINNQILCTGCYGDGGADILVLRRSISEEITDNGVLISTAPSDEYCESTYYAVDLRNVKNSQYSKKLGGAFRLVNDSCIGIVDVRVEAANIHRYER